MNQPNQPPVFHKATKWAENSAAGRPTRRRWRWCGSSCGWVWTRSTMESWCEVSCASKSFGPNVSMAWWRPGNSLETCRENISNLYKHKARVPLTFEVFERKRWHDYEEKKKSTVIKLSLSSPRLPVLCESIQGACTSAVSYRGFEDLQMELERVKRAAEELGLPLGLGKSVGNE